MSLKSSEIRDKLLREVKQNKNSEYRSGYVDGILDSFSRQIKKGEKSERATAGTVR